MVGNDKKDLLNKVFRRNKALTLEKNKNSGKSSKVQPEICEKNRRKVVLGIL
jgi:hypothetical protein